jgi:hypothetical protein
MDRVQLLYRSIAAQGHIKVFQVDVSGLSVVWKEILKGEWMGRREP